MEISPLVIFEAFRQRTPVIVRDLGSLPENIADSDGGFCYKTDIELFQIMDRLRANPALQQRLGENGYRTFHENWTADAHLKRYFNLIDGLAKQEIPNSG